MGKNTSIEWTDHTFNPWWGCEKVSPGCAHCYAETFSRRVGYSDAPHDGEPGSQTGPKVRLWGPGSERRMFGDKHWSEPLAWDRAAAEAGTRARVFCASMADVFEDRPELAQPRARFYSLIDETPHLDWLLLTKRIQNARGLWVRARTDAGRAVTEERKAWQRNVWLGTTVENQEQAEVRTNILVHIPAAVRFLSVEPMLGPIDLFAALFGGRYAFDGKHPDIPGCNTLGFVDGLGQGIDWVIAGGESGPGARPMHPRWARSLRDQCAAASVPFLFKQWGEYAPWVDEDKFVRGGSETGRNAQPFVNLDGGRGTAWVTDGDGTIQNHAGDWRDGDSEILSRVGKKTAGRVLDGRTHDAFPEVSR